MFYSVYNVYALIIKLSSLTDGLQQCCHPFIVYGEVSIFGVAVNLQANARKSC